MPSTKSGRELEGKGSKPVVTQEGTWQCMGGSHLWRPNPPGGQVTAPKVKKDGIWMMKGGSRIWRRTGEREVTTSKNQIEWKTAKGGARQNNFGADTWVRVSNRFSMLNIFGLKLYKPKQWLFGREQRVMLNGCINQSGNRSYSGGCRDQSWAHC